MKTTSKLLSMGRARGEGAGAGRRDERGKGPMYGNCDCLAARDQQHILPGAVSVAAARALTAMLVQAGALSLSSPRGMAERATWESAVLASAHLCVRRAWRWAHGDYFTDKQSQSSRKEYSADAVAMTNEYDSEGLYDMGYGGALEPDSIARREGAGADPEAAALEEATSTEQSRGGDGEDSTSTERAAVSRRLLRVVRGLPG